LDFLKGLYRNPDMPLPVRMKAAVECLPFVHPKLSMTVDASRGESCLGAPRLCRPRDRVDSAGLVVGAAAVPVSIGCSVAPGWRHWP
jgi:hypothetical protein